MPPVPVTPFGYRLLRVIYMMSPIFITFLVSQINNNFNSAESVSEKIWGFLAIIATVLLTAVVLYRREKPIQIHFSTAIALMLTSAILLWLNLRLRSGWPLDARFAPHYWTAAGKEIIEPERLHVFRLMADSYFFYFAINIVYWLCESRIRRQNEKAKFISAPLSPQVTTSDANAEELK